jgi:N-acetyl-anhydromuramyl-L-alanine amidase AmpD
MGFCEDCLETLESDAANFSRVWAEIETKFFAPIVAAQALERLYRISHARIAKRFAGKGVPDFYPTTKKYKGALAGRNDLWWTFHATGGVSINPLLIWFSSEPRPDPKTGKGPLKPRGGSTHFAIDHDGTPWMFIRLNDGAWHCRQRNRDSLSVELINACALKPDGATVDKDNPRFRWWRGLYTLPYDVIEKPFRGNRFYQAYDERQFVSLVKLMRLTTMALGRTRFDEARTCQHFHFNKRKVDCGPLFPQEHIVRAGLGTAKLETYDWIAAFTNAYNPSFDVDTVVDSDELETLFSIAEAENVLNETDGENGETKNPRNSMKWVQSALKDLRINPGPIDGKFGAKTKHAVKLFQTDWNDKHPADAIAVDGIPGPITQAKLQQALESR